MTRDRAISIIIDECFKSGKFYIHDDEYVFEVYDPATDISIKRVKHGVGFYYHPLGVQSFLFDDELSYEMFLSICENGYKDYSDFVKDCTYDLNEKIKSIQEVLYDNCKS